MSASEKMIKFNSTLEQTVITSVLKSKIKNIIRCEKGLMYKVPEKDFLRFGYDSDDFVRNLFTVIIQTDVFRVPRIFNTVTSRRNKRFINSFRRKISPISDNIPL